MGKFLVSLAIYTGLAYSIICNIINLINLIVNYSKNNKYSTIINFILNLYILVCGVTGIIYMITNIRYLI